MGSLSERIRASGYQTSGKDMGARESPVAAVTRGYPGQSTQENELFAHRFYADPTGPDRIGSDRIAAKLNGVDPIGSVRIRNNPDRTRPNVMGPNRAGPHCSGSDRTGSNRHGADLSERSGRSGPNLIGPDESRRTRPEAGRVEANATGGERDGPDRTGS